MSSVLGIRDLGSGIRKTYPVSRGQKCTRSGAASLPRPFDVDTNQGSLIKMSEYWIIRIF
jgi:hypothetical protein